MDRGCIEHSSDILGVTAAGEPMCCLLGSDPSLRSEVSCRAVLGLNRAFLSRTSEFCREVETDRTEPVTILHFRCLFFHTSAHSLG